MPKQSDEVLDEEWRDIPTHPGYQASSLGRIRSIDRVEVNAAGVSSRLKGRILKPQYDKLGRPRVSTSTRRTCTVHSLVAEAFLGIRPTGLDVNHIDANPSNPAASNLEYITHAENIGHSIALGRRHCTRGEGGGNCKTSEEAIVRALKMYSSGSTAREASQATGVSLSVIYSVATGYSWTHLRLAFRKRPPIAWKGKNETKN